MNIMQALCYCPEEIYLNETTPEMLFKKFKYLNFQVIKCFKFDFKLYLPYIFFILFVFNIFLIIETQINFKTELDILYKYCSDFINKNHINQKENHKTIHKANQNKFTFE